jgi:hypothetical protein
MAQLPDYLKTRSDQGVGKKLAGSLGSGSHPRISIENSRFTLKDAAGSELPIETMEQGIPYVDVVIIDSLERISKIYYSGPYGAGKVPDCFSDNGVGPSRHAANPEPTTCAACKKGVWGSAVSVLDPSKKTKACKDFQKLGVMVPPQQGVYLLMVPPNSLKGLRDYLTKFGPHEMDPSDVITRISFVPKVLGTLTFRGIDLIKPDVAARRNELIEAHAADQMLGRMDQPITGAVPAIASSAPAEKPFTDPPLQPAYLAPEAEASAPPAVQEPAPRRPGRPRKAAEGNGAPPQAPFPSSEASKPASGGIEETINDIFK